MDRQIPDVWNIFSIPGPDYHYQRPNYHANYHLNWSNARSQELLHKWSDRSSPCDRPRTYDKFYHKLPGNFIDPLSKSLCSSEADEPVEVTDSSSSTRKKKRKKKGDRKYSRTITERDVRHLDRHLSMKKTIRKKIMRDLQQAFLQDNESPDNLQDMNHLNFDPKKRANNSANLLDVLKQPGSADSELDSGHGTDSGPSPTNEVKRACKNNPVRVQQPTHKYLISDSSSCGGYESAESSEKDIVVLAAEQIHAVHLSSPSSNYANPRKSSSSMQASKAALKNSSEIQTDQPDSSSNVNKKKKMSFWKKLTANLKPSSSSSS